MNPETLIEIDHVTFGYDERRTILNDVSLRFARGKVTSVLGQSGCGKTTLLRLIGGVHGVNSGRVVFDGEVINASDRAQLYRLRRRLGMLFQFGALFTDLSVFDNVAFPLREMTDLPESLIHDIVLMKLNAVGLRGAGCTCSGDGRRTTRPSPPSMRPAARYAPSSGSGPRRRSNRWC